MKNLTKQWREGKLPLGAYYVIYQYNERIWLYRDKSQTPDNNPDIYEIITRVPPYELWEKTKQENKILKKAQYLTFGAPKEAFDRLGDFVEQNSLSCSDLLAVVCAHIANYPQKEFVTKLMVAGIEFEIKIEKK